MFLFEEVDMIRVVVLASGSGNTVCDCTCSTVAAGGVWRSIVRCGYKQWRCLGALVDAANDVSTCTR